MYTKIKQGGTAYDITIPSEYMVTKMRKANLLDHLDTKKSRILNILGRISYINRLTLIMITQFRIFGVP